MRCSLFGIAKKPSQPSIKPLFFCVCCSKSTIFFSLPCQSLREKKEKEGHKKAI